MSAVLFIPLRWKRFLWNDNRKEFFRSNNINEVDKIFCMNKDKGIFDDVKPKGMEEIPTYKDLMKQRHFEIDSTKVIDKPGIILDNKEKENKIMQGWKTWLGAFLMVVSVIVSYVLGMTEIGKAIETLALMFLGVGIAHKVEKAVK